MKYHGTDRREVRAAKAAQINSPGIGPACGGVAEDVTLSIVKTISFS